MNSEAFTALGKSGASPIETKKRVTHQPREIKSGA